MRQIEQRPTPTTPGGPRRARPLWQAAALLVLAGSGLLTIALMGSVLPRIRRRLRIWAR